MLLNSTGQNKRKESDVLFQARQDNKLSLRRPEDIRDGLLLKGLDQLELERQYNQNNSVHLQKVKVKVEYF